MRKLKVITIALLISLLLGQHSPVSASNELVLDPKLSLQDKEELIRVMTNLDEGDRKNVLLIREDGTFIANRIELMNEFIEQNKTLIHEGKIIDIADRYRNELSNSEEISNKDYRQYFPDASNSPPTTLAYTNPTSACPSANSGPFRRVKSTNGFSRLIANIYLPSKSLSEIYMANGTNDKAYIYTGASTSKGLIDMGLAFNYAAGSNYWDETWGMFVKGHSSPASPAEYGNFKMGQTIFMKYYTPSYNQAALYVSGVDKSGVPSERTLVVNVSTAKSFKANGSGMQVKRAGNVP